MAAELVVTAPMTPKRGEKPVGRPPIYSEAKALEFCRRISEGRSERSVCKDADMPSRETVWKWDEENPEFSRRYARAREDRASHLAEEALSIGDALGDAPTSEQVQAARLKVDTRKWFAAKLSPRKYGDRLQTDATVNANVTGDLTMRVSAMSDDELARILADARADVAAGRGLGVETPSGS